MEDHKVVEKIVSLVDIFRKIVQKVLYNSDFVGVFRDLVNVLDRSR